MKYSESRNSDITACFQFTSNSIQLAASFEILDAWTKVESFHLNYYWLGASTKYPSRMSRGMDSWQSVLSRIPLSISRPLRQIAVKSLLMSSSLKSSDELTKVHRILLDQLRNMTDLQDFQKLNSEGIRPGGALANAFVAESGKRHYDSKVDESLASLLLLSYLTVFYGVLSEISTNGITRVLIYNGRFLHERATWEAAKLARVEVFIFETTRDRFHLRQNFGFHDRTKNQEIMKSLWNEKSKELGELEMEKIGSRYFVDLESKRNRFFSDEIDSNLEKPSLIFFSNSDDEAVGFWDSWTEPFIDQVEFITRLQSHLETRRKEYLYVRLHPNLASKPIEEQNRWLLLRDTKFSKIIQPNDQVSSYTLLKGSSGVISYGSTMGLEAAFHRIPSAILADCWYDELGVANKLESFEDVIKWIESIENKYDATELQNRRRKSMVRGFWLEKSGESFEHCDMHEISWGAWEVRFFKGKRISRPKFFSVVSIITNRIKRGKLGLNPR